LEIKQQIKDNADELNKNTGEQAEVESKGEEDRLDALLGSELDLLKYCNKLHEAKYKLEKQIEQLVQQTGNIIS